MAPAHVLGDKPVDRKSIVDTMLPGVGKPRNSSFDPSVTGDDMEQYTYDPDKAAPRAATRDR